MKTENAFTARFEGHCVECRTAIVMGDQIRREGDGYVHAGTCPETADPLAVSKTETLCPACWQYHAGKCSW